MFLNSVSPKLGKLSNPHEFPIPLKNHLKQLQQKLMLKYLPSFCTWFLKSKITVLIGITKTKEIASNVMCMTLNHHKRRFHNSMIKLRNYDQIGSMTSGSLACKHPKSIEIMTVS